MSQPKINGAVPTDLMRAYIQGTDALPRHASESVKWGEAALILQAHNKPAAVGVATLLEHAAMSVEAHG